MTYTFLTNTITLSFLTSSSPSPSPPSPFSSPSSSHTTPLPTAVTPIRPTLSLQCPYHCHSHLIVRLIDVAVCPVDLIYILLFICSILYVTLHAEIRHKLAKKVLLFRSDGSVCVFLQQQAVLFRRYGSFYVAVTEKNNSKNGYFSTRYAPY